MTVYIGPGDPCKPQNVSVSALNDLLCAVRMAVQMLPTYDDPDWNNQPDNLRCDMDAARVQLIAATGREKIHNILNECHITRLHNEQASRVMPLIGPLIDAWDGLSNDFTQEIGMESPALVDVMRCLHTAIQEPPIEVTSDG